MMFFINVVLAGISAGFARPKHCPRGSFPQTLDEFSKSFHVFRVFFKFSLFLLSFKYHRVQLAKKVTERGTRTIMIPGFLPVKPLEPNDECLTKQGNMSWVLTVCGEGYFEHTDELLLRLASGNLGEKRERSLI